MLTNTDINKLKKVFFTKEEFRTQLREELKNYPTRFEMRAELMAFRAEWRQDLKDFKEEMFMRFDNLVSELKEIVCEGAEKQANQDRKIQYLEMQSV